MLDPSLISRLGLPDNFPKFFPSVIEVYRRIRSAASDTPDEYVVAYMIATGGTAIGGNVTGWVQKGWPVRSNFFVVIVGCKGMGKSVLADSTFAPLRAHEEILRQLAEADEAVFAEDDDSDSEYGDDEDRPRHRGRADRHEPCVIVNDATIQAVHELLQLNERQLLVHTDEVASLFGSRGGGGAARQVWCELYDGRSRRKHRVSDRQQSGILKAPYVSMLGTIQPSLLACTYNPQGDDGLVDRMLLFGNQQPKLPSWPTDADDPATNQAWAAVIERLLNIETLAANAHSGKVEVVFQKDALEVFKSFHDDIVELVISLGLPEEQFGVITKIRAQALRLALLHRCFRWAAGEFGEHGPLGDIDRDDAMAACLAAKFILGRWIMWRTELQPAGDKARTEVIGLLQPPGQDPALQSLAAAAAGSNDGVRVIERLVRNLRRRGPGPFTLASLLTVGPLATDSPEDLSAACNWLVECGHAVWLDDSQEAIILTPIPEPRPRRARTAGRRAVRS